LAALSQAKLDYVRKLLEICAQYRLKIFAAISSEPIRETDDETNGLLRRDYVYALSGFIIIWKIKSRRIRA
jgi:hypothetical protein